MKSYSKVCVACGTGLIGKYRSSGLKLCASCFPKRMVKSDSVVCCEDESVDGTTVFIGGLNTKIDYSESDAFYHTGDKVDADTIRGLAEFHYWRKRDSCRSDQVRLRLDKTEDGGKWGSYSWKTPDVLEDDMVDSSLPEVVLPFKTCFSDATFFDLEPFQYDAPNVDSCYAKESAAWLSDLTVDEINAVTWWTSNGSGVISDWFRGVTDNVWDIPLNDDSCERIVDLIDEAIDKSELSEPIVGYRGGNVQELGMPVDATFEDLCDMKGSNVVFETPKSSSLRHSKGASFVPFESGVLMEIKSGFVGLPGVTGAWGLHEMESIMPSGSYKVVDVKKVDVKLSERYVKEDVTLIQIEFVDI